jgi:hypothetical protein
LFDVDADLSMKKINKIQRELGNHKKVYSGGMMANMCSSKANLPMTG